MTTMQVLHLPITKVDEAQRLVYAVMADETPDKAREAFDYDASKPNIQKWSDAQFDASAGKSYGNVRAMHGKIAAGIVAQPLGFDDLNKRVEMCAKVTDDQEWAKCLDGTYTGVSIGGRYGARVLDKATGVTRYEAIPAEVSLVDNPCIPTARFTLVKADGAEEQIPFKERAKMAVTNEVVVERARELAKAAGVEMQDAHVAAAREELEKAAAGEGGSTGDKPADLVEKKADDGKPGTVTPEPRELVKQAWLASDGKPFEKKADAVAHEATLAKSDPSPADKLTAALGDLAKAVDGVASGTVGTEAEYPKVGDLVRMPTDKAKTVVVTSVENDKVTMSDGSTAEWAKDYPEMSVTQVDNDRVWSTSQAGKADAAGDLRKGGDAPGNGDKPYGDVEYADPGFQADKKKRYPVDNEAHIRAGWSYIHKGKNASKYSADQIGKVKGKIASAWKAKIDKAGPPDMDKAANAETLQKGMWGVSRLASLIEELVWLQRCCDDEAEIEGDGSEQPAKLKEAIATLVACLKGMVDEETSELFTENELVDFMEVLECMERPSGADALAKHAPKHADALAKVGSRHNKADMGKIQSMHDQTVSLGAKCSAEKADAAGDMTKLAGENADLRKAVDAAVAKIGELGDRVTKLAETPAQPRPIRSQVHVVEKSADGQSANDILAKADPDLVATALVRLAQSQGRTIFPHS